MSRLAENRGYLMFSIVELGLFKSLLLQIRMDSGFWIPSVVEPAAVGHVTQACV